jgi:hypothetical protein
MGMGMETVSHFIFDDRVQIYRRENTKFWQCAATVNGHRFRRSTKEDSLSHAKEIAEDWYLELRGKSRAGLLKHDKTFSEVADQFLKEYEVITEGQRSSRWTEGHSVRLRVHLNPFFGDLLMYFLYAANISSLS